MDHQDVGPIALVGGWHDPATGFFGPRSWDAIVSAETGRCARYGRSATIVIVEVGRLDEPDSAWVAEVEPSDVLRVAGALRATARSSDYVARLGLRRFGVLLAETDEIAAVNFVERAREACASAAQIGTARLRFRFGWADATKDRALRSAAEVALERLAGDRPSGASSTTL